MEHPKQKMLLKVTPSQRWRQYQRNPIQSRQQLTTAFLASLPPMLRFCPELRLPNLYLYLHLHLPQLRRDLRYQRGSSS